MSGARWRRRLAAAGLGAAGVTLVVVSLAQPVQPVAEDDLPSASDIVAQPGPSRASDQASGEQLWLQTSETAFPGGPKLFAVALAIDTEPAGAADALPEPSPIVCS